MRVIYASAFACVWDLLTISSQSTWLPKQDACQIHKARFLQGFITLFLYEQAVSQKTCTGFERVIHAGAPDVTVSM